MSIIKNPCLSLGARGSIGEAVTFARRRKTNIVEKKPELPYFRTLPVQYQRWLYEDYAYLWRQQTAATKQLYATAGSRYHLTGFQQWMKYQLTNLPDIDLWWKLDVIIAGQVADSSKNNHLGAVIGASPVDGAIGGALDQDGLNDRVTTPVTANLGFTGEMTLITIWKPTAFARWHRIISCDQPGDPRYLLYQRPTNQFEFYAHDGVVGPAQPISPLAYSVSRYHSLICRIDANSVDLLVDGVEVATVPIVLSPFTPANLFQLGAYAVPPAHWAEGITDNVIKFNRRLDDTECLRWAGRRFP